ncbi:MAG: hypothetical protein C5S40_07460 [ANME-2 cluster archaeon]|nr:hypothetical protein [ANME-2 cluster archaeon]
MIPKFINRENELDFLENCYKSPQPEFIIIYGRRRVGKTELIQRSLQNKHGAYFLASKDTTYENINEFRKTIAEQLDIPIFSRIESNVTTAHPTAAEMRGMMCRRFVVLFSFKIQKFHLLATFLFFFSTLRLNIPLYDISCNSISDRPYISTITPKMSTPQLFLNIEVFLENVLGRNTFNNLHNP